MLVRLYAPQEKECEAMDRMTEAVIGDTKYYLNYSVAVMFDMVEKFGNLNAALDILLPDNRDSFDALRWFFVKMVNDAELCRRDAGYDHGKLLEESDISPRMSPLDYAVMKAAVIDAINRGYLRETATEDKEDIDLGLEELRAKK